MRRLRQGKGWLWLVGAVLCTLVIWGNSLKDVEHSAAQSQRVLEVVEPVLNAVQVQESGRHHLVRKAAHAIEFVSLGLCWALFFRSRGRKPAVLALSAAGLCALTAALDETIQLFVPGRGAQLSDVWLDVRGALCAILLVALLEALRRHFSTKDC